MDGWIDNACCCGATAGSVLFVARDVNGGATDASGEIRACAACCGLFPARFVVADAAVEAYRGYYTRRAARSAWRNGARRAMNAARRRYLDRHTPSGARRLLDFGCGGGDYLTRMAVEHPALDLYGTDAFEPARTDAFAWIAADAVAASGPFDWITLGHVLEHLPDPAATLALLAECLTPDGALWIATPNAQSFIIKTAGPWARDIDFPRHRQIFSRAGLERLLAEAGLRADYHPAPRLNAVLNAAATLSVIARDSGGSEAARAAAAFRTVAGLIGHLAWPRLATAPEWVAVCRRTLVAGGGIEPPTCGL